MNVSPKRRKSNPFVRCLCQPPNDRLQQTVVDKVPRHVCQRAAAETGTSFASRKCHGKRRELVRAVEKHAVGALRGAPIPIRRRPMRPKTSTIACQIAVAVLFACRHEEPARRPEAIAPVTVATPAPEPGPKQSVRPTPAEQPRSSAAPEDRVPAQSLGTTLPLSTDRADRRQDRRGLAYDPALCDPPPTTRAA